MPHAQHRSIKRQFYSLWYQTLDEQTNNNTTETVCNYNVLFVLPLCFLSFDLPILINPFDIFKLSLAVFLRCTISQYTYGSFRYNTRSRRWPSPLTCNDFGWGKVFSWVRCVYCFLYDFLRSTIVFYCDATV